MEQRTLNIGVQGPQGKIGDQGDQGPQGTAVTGGVTDVNLHMVSISAGGANKSATSSCTTNGQNGEIPIGGGASVSGTISQVAIQSSQVVDGDLTTSLRGWTGSRKRFGGGYTLTFRVICATAPAP